jgi:hypothetical protein
MDCRLPAGSWKVSVAEDYWPIANLKTVVVVSFLGFWDELCQGMVRDVLPRPLEQFLDSKTWKAI